MWNRRMFLRTGMGGLLTLPLLGAGSARADATCIRTAKDDELDRLKPLVKGNQHFACDLHAWLRREAGNLFCSPYSISTALAMTYAGARGGTAAEMARTLHLPGAQDELPALYGKLTQALHGHGLPRAYQLHIANAIWGQRDYHFLPELLTQLRDHYGAPLREVDFGRSEEARQTINRWVEQQTHDRIKELIQQGILNGAVRLVLTNAIYFKAAWAQPFSKKVTRDGDFTLVSGQKVAVPMMRQTDTFAYADAGNVQVLELPYENQELSMVVLLPKRADGLGDLERTLTSAQLDRWLERTSRHHVELILPRFKIEAKFRLEQALSDLGMPSAFGADADFSGMNGLRNLYISAVIHKAFVDVHEDGTEAAAATAVVMKEISMIGPPAVFHAHHPFMFLIRDNATRSILFLGRMENPRA